MATNHTPLSLKTKIAYGVGDVSAAISAQVTGFFLTAFLLDIARIRPGTVSIIILISNLWEAITDPIVGNLSDRTRTRWVPTATLAAVWRGALRPRVYDAVDCSAF